VKANAFLAKLPKGGEAMNVYEMLAAILMSIMSVFDDIRDLI